MNLTELKNIHQFVKEYKAVRAKYIYETKEKIVDTNDLHQLTLLYYDLMENIEDYIISAELDLTQFESIADWMRNLSDVSTEFGYKWGYLALSHLARLK